jgi:hypothetical protein
LAYAAEKFAFTTFGATLGFTGIKSSGEGAFAGSVASVF